MSTNRQINTFAVLDLETTGLVKPGITEVAIHAFAAKDVRTATNCTIPRINHKLSLLFNPEKQIHPEAEKISGLSNSMLESESSFDRNAAGVLVNFLNHLSQPVCLVAHNGYKFDFPIFKQAIDLHNVELPSDLVCIDSLEAVRKLDKPASSYKLQDVYTRVFGSAPQVAHHAGADVDTLQKVILHFGGTFVEFAEKNAKPFCNINAARK